MLEAAARTLIDTRNQLHESCKELTPEQWFTIPQGFTNNIAWNVGHLVLAQQGLTYTRLGVRGYVGREFAALYSPGTSPADWSENPDTSELLSMAVDFPQKLVADIAAGKFEISELPDVPFMPKAHSVEHAFIHTQFHEGVHMGAIDLLKSFVS